MIALPPAGVLASLGCVRTACTADGRCYCGRPGGCRRRVYYGGVFFELYPDGGWDWCRRPSRPKLRDAGRRRILVRDGYTCCLCGNTKEPEVDHFIPVTRGGTNDPSNLWTLCHDCNKKKAFGMPTAAHRSAWERQIR